MILKSRQGLKKEREREKKTFQGMFDRFVQQDEEEEVKQKLKEKAEKAKIKAEKKKHSPPPSSDDQIEVN